MNEAAARAYLSQHPDLPGLRAPCLRCGGTLIRNAALVPGCFDGRPCENCQGTGEVARDWYGGELQLALRLLGWRSQVTCGQFYCRATVVYPSPKVRPGPTAFEGQGATPDKALSIAAALALQQEEARGRVAAG